MPTDDAKPPLPTPPCGPMPALRAVPVDGIDSRSLLQGRDSVVIVHRGELYRLRATRQGKLILTK